MAVRSAVRRPTPEHRTLWTLLTGTNATVGPYPSVVLPGGKITLVPFTDVGATNQTFFR